MKRLLAIAGKSMAFPSCLKLAGFLSQVAAISIDSTQKDFEVMSRMSSIKDFVIKETPGMNKSSIEYVVKSMCKHFCSAYFCTTKSVECLGACSEMCTGCSCYSRGVCRPRPVDQIFLGALEKNEEKDFWDECKEFCYVSVSVVNRGDPQEGKCIEERPSEIRHEVNQVFITQWSRESGKEEL